LSLLSIIVHFRIVGRALEVKQPIEADFDVQVRGSNVELTFKPTTSHYSFPLRHRGISPRAKVRHAKTVGEYALGDVEAMAFRVASAAAKGR
jgi:hypothetical protein